MESNCTQIYMEMYGFTEAQASGLCANVLAKEDGNAMFKLVMSAMIFMMQPGFMLLEVGAVQSKNAATVVLKNVVDVAIGFLTWWLVGYWLAYGENGASPNAFIGSNHFAFSGLELDEDRGYRMLSSWFFQVRTIFSSIA